MQEQKMKGSVFPNFWRMFLCRIVTCVPFPTWCFRLAQDGILRRGRKVFAGYRSDILAGGVLLKKRVRIIYLWWLIWSSRLNGQLEKSSLFLQLSHMSRQARDSEARCGDGDGDGGRLKHATDVRSTRVNLHRDISQSLNVALRRRKINDRE